MYEHSMQRYLPVEQYKPRGQVVGTTAGNLPGSCTVKSPYDVRYERVSNVFRPPVIRFAGVQQCAHRN